MVDIMSAFMLLSAIIGGLLFIVLVEGVIRKTPVAAGLILIYFVLDSAGVELPFIGAGGITVYISDLLSIILIIGATARLLRARRLTTGQYILLAIAALIVLSLLRGVMAYGIQRSVNEARSWIAFASAAVYFSTVGPAASVRSRIGRLWLWSGVVLAALAVVRWAVLAAGVPLGGIFVNGDGDSLRVLVSDPAAFIALSFFIVAPALRNPGQKTYRRIAVGLLAVAVLLQHRSVWVAIVLGLFVLMRRDPRLGRRFAIALVTAVIVGGTLVLTVFNNQPEELSSTATNAQTFGWRVEGWRQLILEDGPSEPVEIISGKPFGYGWDRRVGGVLVADASPHSFWVEALLRLGVAGVAALIFCYGRPILTRLRRPPHPIGPSLLNDDVLVCLLVVQAVYGFAYNPPSFPVGIIVGLALSAGLQRGAVSEPGTEAGAEPPPPHPEPHSRTPT